MIVKDNGITQKESILVLAILDPHIQVKVSSSKWPTIFGDNFTDSHAFFSFLGCNKGALTSPELPLTYPCFRVDEAQNYVKDTGNPYCASAEMIEKDGQLYQIGGPPHPGACQHKLGFMFPYEAGFVVNFTLAEDNTPQGCGVLDGDWRLNNMRPINEEPFIYPGKNG